MPQLIEHLADTTGFHDREMLDVTVVQAIQGVLHPPGVCIYRCGGEPGSQRWLRRARHGLGDASTMADPPWTDMSQLPLLGEVPPGLACRQRVEVIEVGEQPQVIYFPIATEREVIGVLEIVTGAPLPSTNEP